MNSEMQLKVQAYLDNELTPREARHIASLLTTDPEARDLFNELKGTKSVLGLNEPAHALPESRDFYWSKIQREISKSAPEPRPAHSISWWMRLAAPMAGAIALFAILLSISGSRTGDIPTISLPEVVNASAQPMHQGEVVVPDMSAITFRSEAEGVTVVWVSSDVPIPEEAPSLLDWFE